ncbi:MAG: recombination regulator RecX [Propionibacteriaceae bacterium]|jgi:regulatory protein|nr:recombination regulator RecX [Propionibacteriaceae bacterium]
MEPDRDSAGEARQQTIASLKEMIAGVGQPAAADAPTPSNDHPAREDSDRRDSIRHESAPHSRTGEASTSLDGVITDVDLAREIALNRLTVRARSRLELRRDLIRRRVDPDVADQVLERLEAVGLVDDAEFARQWVASRRELRSLSKARLRHELSQVGVASAVITTVLNDLDDDDAGMATNLARRRIRPMLDLDDSTIIRRLSGQLMRRGFSPSQARSAVMTALDEARSGEDPSAQ